ncbi:MAG TPA: MFS transporter [Candidatus Dormibacteraeota bacterium]|nr:MFS transporter [Candidatus Dormibacteraeota bacterium]
MQRLERDRSFLLLWAGQTTSTLGSAVSDLAIPTAAIFLFHAGAFQVSLLGALETLPFIGVGLLLGPLADRVRRRPILIACDLARFGILGSIPVAAAAGELTLYQLYAAAFLTGIFNVFFQVAYQAYLPALVSRQRIMGANSRLSVTQTIAGTVGPAIGGFLIQEVGAAMAVAVDSASYLLSALAVLLIRKPEPTAAPGPRASFRTELAEGLRFVFGSPVLRRLAAGNATFTIGWRMIEAILLLFCYRVLRMTPAQVGILFAVTSICLVAGTLARERVTRMVGFGRLLFLSQLACALPIFLMAGAGLGLGVPALYAAFSIQGLASGMFDVAQLTLRQLITPDRLQARMNATMRTLFWGPRPLGFLLGGAVGSWIGLVPTIAIGAVICTISAAFFFGPVFFVMRTAPEPVHDG